MRNLYLPTEIDLGTRLPSTFSSFNQITEKAVVYSALKFLSLIVHSRYEKF